MESLKKGIQQLSPSYFALVMATGIVSSASNIQHYTVISNLFFWIANLAFFILFLLFVLRCIIYFPDVLADLSSHAKGAGFLTLVAGACILGTLYIQAKGAVVPAIVLWSIGVMMWLIIIYSFLSGVILKKDKPSPEIGLNGTWFMLVVSTQSISILGGLLAPHFFWTQAAVFLSLSAFLLGVVLYLILVPVIINRLLFYPLKPEEVVPSYWINMGAAAITTLSGVMLSKIIKDDPQFGDFYSFVHATALLFWCLASFWIPLIFIMEIWRYVIKQSPLKYAPEFWSLVFPLGMYTVSTWMLAEATRLNFLQSLSKGFIYIAWAAWITTFFGLLFHLVEAFRKSSSANEI